MNRDFIYIKNKKIPNEIYFLIKCTVYDKEIRDFLGFSEMLIEKESHSYAI